MPSRCPPGVVCIENITLGISIIVVLAAVWFYYKNHVVGRNVKVSSAPLSLELRSFLGGASIPTSCGTCPFPRATPAASATNTPNDVYLNPYAAPLRDGTPCGQPSSPGVPINIRTRGVDVAYRQVGILTQEGGKDLILPLMGRPLQPGRDKWNFYTMAGNQAQVKLPVKSRGRNCTSEYGCDDLSTGDLVSAEGYGGAFKVTMYENEGPRYLPCAF